VVLLGKGGPSGTQEKFLLILLKSVKMILLLRIQMAAVKMEICSLVRMSLMIMGCTKAVQDTNMNVLMV